MSAALLTLICLIVRYSITTYLIQKHKPSGKDISYFISFLIQAITVVVVSVPEGNLTIVIFVFLDNNHENDFLVLQVFHWLSRLLLPMLFELVININKLVSGNFFFPSFRK